MGRAEKRRKPIQQKPKVNVATWYAREHELLEAFKQERDHIIDDSCEMYSIALAMTLHDRCDKTKTWVNNCLVYIEKLCVEFKEGRLSIADCRRVLIDEIDLIIGTDEKYVPMETTDPANSTYQALPYLKGEITND